MSSAYGSLLAQVIPVIALALVLELRAIIAAGKEEKRRVDEYNERMRKYRQSQASSRNPLKKLANFWRRNRMPMESTAPIRRNGLSDFDTTGFVVIYGALLTLLAREEIVALMAAQEYKIPYFERLLANILVSVCLFAAFCVPAGLELYHNFNGIAWSHRKWAAIAFLGFVAAIFTTGTTWLYIK
ncbi:hypothetical protein [Actinomadura sp. NPDC000600]|uniref:hypothetical protein n=1 Tax=Actinomadura sp. NPDC000600 TaxID=3154262 RepID=UPI003392293B